MNKDDNLKGHYFKKGQSGNPAGRPKGVRYAVDEILKRKNCNPFEILCDIAMATGDFHRAKIQYRLDAAKTLASYVGPKVKSIPFSPDEKNPFVIYLNTGALPAKGAK